MCTNGEVRENTRSSAEVFEILDMAVQETDKVQPTTVFHCEETAETQAIEEEEDFQSEENRDVHQEAQSEGMSERNTMDDIENWIHIGESWQFQNSKAEDTVPEVEAVVEAEDTVVQVEAIVEVSYAVPEVETVMEAEDVTAEVEIVEKAEDSAPETEAIVLVETNEAVPEIEEPVPEAQVSPNRDEAKENAVSNMEATDDVMPKDEVLEKADDPAPETKEAAPEMEYVASKKSSPPATTPRSRDKKAGWFKEHQKYVDTCHNSTSGILLIGDSMISGLARYPTVWKNFFVPMEALNFGIGGDRTQHVLYRVENGEIPQNVEIIVIHVGTNNTDCDKPKDIANGIASIAIFFQEMKPNVKIIITGLLPRGLHHCKRRDTVNEVNKYLQHICSGTRLRNVYYLPPSDDWIEADGKLNESLYFQDNLHLSEEGNKKFASAIQRLIQAVQKGETPHCLDAEVKYKEVKIKRRVKEDDKDQVSDGGKEAMKEVADDSNDGEEKDIVPSYQQPDKTKTGIYSTQQSESSVAKSPKEVQGKTEPEGNKKEPVKRRSYQCLQPEDKNRRDEYDWMAKKVDDRSRKKERSPEKLPSDDVDKIEQNETSDKVVVKEKQREGQQKKVEIFSWFKKRRKQWEQRHPGVYSKSRNNEMLLKRFQQCTKSSRLQ